MLWHTDSLSVRDVLDVELHTPCDFEKSFSLNLTCAIFHSLELEQLAVDGMVSSRIPK
jgi:hypothetical protein